MNADGPISSPFDGKSTEQIISTLSSRSDNWYNLALAFPRLYLEGFDRQTLEELINVEPARQEIWSVAGAVFLSIQVCYRPFATHATYSTRTWRVHRARSPKIPPCGTDIIRHSTRSHDPLRRE